MGSAWVLKAELPVVDIAASVEATTLPTTVAMADSWLVMTAIPASDRIDETRDWMF